MLDYLIVIPAHNEERYLRDAVEKCLKVLRTQSDNFLLVIAEDGSTDRTAEIAESLQEEYEEVVNVHYPTKLGRGMAVERIWASLEARVYAFMDCDLAVELRYFETLLGCIHDGADVATGSRYLPGSITSRPMLRKFASKCYNRMVRFLLNTNCSDHQCGFKAISNSALKKIIQYTNTNGWAWDSELLVIASKLKLSISEIPVIWTEKRSRRTPLVRLMKDIREHGIWILKLFYWTKFRHLTPTHEKTYPFNGDDLKLLNSRYQRVVDRQRIPLQELTAPAVSVITSTQS
jgi:glycosyltransferase involved in cell wall biosynthesis